MTRPAAAHRRPRTEAMSWLNRMAALAKLLARTAGQTCQNLAADGPHSYLRWCFAMEQKRMEGAEEDGSGDGGGIGCWGSARAMEGGGGGHQGGWIRWVLVLQDPGLPATAWIRRG